MKKRVFVFGLFTIALLGTFTNVIPSVMSFMVMLDSHSQHIQKDTDSEEGSIKLDVKSSSTTAAAASSSVPETTAHDILRPRGGGDAIVLCFMDGSIVTLDAWTGTVRGIPSYNTNTGGPILRSSGILGSLNDEHQQQRIVPALDGTLFVLRQEKEEGIHPQEHVNGEKEEEEDPSKFTIQPNQSFQLEELPLKIQDVVDQPVSMCYPTSSTSTFVSSSLFHGKTQETPKHENHVPSDNDDVKGQYQQQQQEEEECGIIMGQKSTLIYAINPLLGTVRALQQQPSLSQEQSSYSSYPYTATTTSSSFSHSPWTLFLQRTDYSIQHVHIHTGKEMWNISFGQFTPLDFTSSSTSRSADAAALQLVYETTTSSSSSCPRPGRSRTIHKSQSSSTTITFPLSNNNKNHQKEEEITAPLPYLYFDHSQPVPYVLAIDPLTLHILWKQSLTSIVAIAQGTTMRRNIRGTMTIQWTDLQVLDTLPMETLVSLNMLHNKDSDSSAFIVPYTDKEKRQRNHDWTLYLPSTSTISSLSTYPSLNSHSKDLFQPLVVDRTNPLSLTSSQEKETTTSTALTIIPTSMSSFISISTDDTLKRDEGHGNNYFHDHDGESEETLENEDEGEEDQYLINNHYGYYYTLPRYTSSHKTEHGLFLSWTLVTAMVSCMVAGVIGGRILYLKKRQKWIMESHTPKFMALYPNSNSEDGSTCLVPPPLTLEADIAVGGTQNTTSIADMTSNREKFPSSIASVNHSSKQDFTTRSTELPPVTHMDGIPLVRYLRYRSEFDEIQALGSGGFGTVYKTRNKLDGIEYAVKKVLIQSPLDPDGNLSPYFSKRFHRVLREVKILALLDHPNIVRYYTAWLEIEDDYSVPSGITIEDAVTGDGRSSDNTYSCVKSSTDGMSRGFSSDFLVGQAPQYPSSSSFHHTTFQHHPQYSSEEDLGFTWERNEGPQSPYSNVMIEDSNSLNDSCDNYIQRAHRDNENDSTGTEPYFKGHATDTSSGMKPQQKILKIQRHILYIQMQLSKKTLLDYFAARHSSIQQAPVDIIVVLHLFAHIVRGVKHVHRQGLIHRDLKPSNCFMDDDDDLVKIGDFGLSRESGDVYADEGDASNTYFSKIENTENTAGVGTSSYASPEQISGSDYDSSTDIYSLGIMLFELCYPMMTVCKGAFLLREHYGVLLTLFLFLFLIGHGTFQSFRRSSQVDTPIPNSLVQYSCKTVSGPSWTDSNHDIP